MNLKGYLIDAQSNDDLLLWAASIAICRTDRIQAWLRDSTNLTDGYIEHIIETIEEAYRVYEVEKFINQHDWIISQRSDDGLWRFIVSFFSNELTIKGLRRVYLECSFGEQLVLKTDRATHCLHFVDCEFYDDAPYANQYKDITQRNSDHFYTILEECNAEFADDDDLTCSEIIWGYYEKQRVLNDEMF